MSIQASTSTLKTLQVLDVKIAKLDAELSSERTNIDAKSERHVSLVTHVAKLEGMIEAMEGTKGELNGELRTQMQQVEKSREKMTRCRNEREANAAQRELEEIRRLCRDRELEITKLGGLIEDARADLAKVEAERVEVASQIDETQGEATSRVRELQAEMDVELKKRAEAMSDLKPIMQRRYEAVRKKRGTGAAAVVEGSCTACHISLSPMLYQEILRLQELHECPSCHRLLYHVEKGAPGDPTSVGVEEEASDGAEAADETQQAATEA